MDHEMASELIKCLAELSDPLNRATELTFRFPEIEEQREVRGALAEIMSEIYELVDLVARKYPDLDPIKDR